MVRPLRITYNGAWYHIMNRGLERRKIFLIDQHRKIFLDLLEEISNYYLVEVHSYCLMDNHYHLLIRTPFGNISRAMQHLDGVYTQRFNVLTKRDGPLFRGRYKSKLIEAEQYLLRVSRYIHCNPVEAGIVNDADTYKWSSYQAYLDKVEAPEWLVQGDIRHFFDKECFSDMYRQFVEKGNEVEFSKQIEASKANPILGSDIFIDEVTKKYLKREHCVSDIPEHKMVLRLPEAREIIEAVSEYYALSSKEIIARRKKRTNLPRSMAMYLCRQLGQLKLGEVADHFKGLREYGVSKSCKRFEVILYSNEQVFRDLKAIKAKLFNKNQL